MALIDIFDGSFPAQSAMILKKSTLIKHATLALKDSTGEKVFYNVRNAVQSIEVITPHEKKPGFKIVLKDGEIIVARSDNKTIEDIRLIIAAGPDEDGSILIKVPEKKTKDTAISPVTAKVGRFITWIIATFLVMIGLLSLMMGLWYGTIILFIVAISIMPPVLPNLPIFLGKTPATKIVSLLLLGVLALFIGGIVMEPDPKMREMAQNMPYRSPSATAETKPTKAPTEKDAHSITVTLCEMRVEKGLRAPRTAKFPWTKEVSFDGKTATLVSYVDAQNGFGAMIRTNYICTVEYVSGKPSDISNWRLKDVATLD